MKKSSLPATTFAGCLLLTGAAAFAAATNLPSPLGRPLAMADCLDLALQKNSAVLKSQADLEAVHGVIVQTRAIAQPKVRLVSEFSAVDGDSIETVPASGTTVNFGAEERWTAEVRITQSIYEGGRINSALRSARLTKQQSLLNHQTVIANTLLDVRVAYYGVLLAAQQIIVQEAAVNLRQSEVEDATRRFNAGTSKRFNVLRAEVEVANVKPRLIRARNAHRIGKNNLVNLLGFNLPKEVLEDVPLQLTGRLDADAYDIALPDAVARALANRTELAALRTGIGLREEAIISARSNYKPAVQLYAGYGGHSSQFVNDLEREVHGWSAGAQMSWNIFDGKLTAGKVRETTALRDKSKLETDDVARKIELEVRTAYSTFIEAREVLETQKKVQEQAEEALRQVNVLYQEGAMGGTQFDVLNAQTALTEARTTQIQALHDYDVARARLERAVGPAPAGK